MNSNRITASLLVIITYLVSAYIMPEIWTWIYEDLKPLQPDSRFLRHVEFNLLKVAPLLLVTLWLFPKQSLSDVWGVRPRNLMVVGLGAIAVLPMLLGYSLMSDGVNLDADLLLRNSLSAGFFEELIYRAFLFGLLFRYCGWGFLPAALLGSIVFGLGHAYQGQDAAGVLMAVVFSGIGAVWFSWLYAEFEYNLWLPVT